MRSSYACYALLHFLSLSLAALSHFLTLLLAGRPSTFNPDSTPRKDQRSLTIASPPTVSNKHPKNHYKRTSIAMPTLWFPLAMSWKSVDPVAEMDTFFASCVL